MPVCIKSRITDNDGDIFAIDYLFDRKDPLRYNKCNCNISNQVCYVHDEIVILNNTPFNVYEANIDELFS